MRVCAAGHDKPFVNNYGVWKDEFRDLGLEDTLNCVWDDATCWFGEGNEVWPAERPEAPSWWLQPLEILETSLG